MTESAFADIARIIQLAVAPVFLLVAIGSFINVATTRLGRTVDRARAIEDLLRQDDPDRQSHTRELAALGQRITFANWAINLWSASALLVAIDVALLFIADIMNADFSIFVAILFIFAMIGIVAGFFAFLAEISVATRTLKIRAELLSLSEKDNAPTR